MMLGWIAVESWMVREGVGRTFMCRDMHEAVDFSRRNGMCADWFQFRRLTEMLHSPGEPWQSDTGSKGGLRRLRHGIWGITHAARLGFEDVRTSNSLWIVRS